MQAIISRPTKEFAPTRTKQNFLPCFAVRAWGEGVADWSRETGRAYMTTGLMSNHRLGQLAATLRVLHPDHYFRRWMYLERRLAARNSKSHLSKLP